MKKTRVLLVEDDPLIRTAVGLTLQNLGYAIVGTATDRCETLRLLKALTPELVVISPGVLEKTGMGLVCEVLAKKYTSVFVIPGHPIDLSARSTSLLRPADLASLLAISRVIQVLFGRKRFVLN
jgi:chemotaxis response regulator CheB